MKSLLSLLVVLGIFILVFTFVQAATPVGPDVIGVVSNETKSATGAYALNISGGYIATLNLSATVQNPRWKGIVGNVTGSFTLDDAAGSTLFDWTLASITGNIFATRNGSSLSWTSLVCANVSLLEIENGELNHTSTNDNITVTFNDTTHAEIIAAGVTLPANNCSTLNTYVNSSSQQSQFEEIIVSTASNHSDGGDVIYVTPMEDDEQGFDASFYDFQMIVPEDGTPGFTGQTTYFIYVELT